MITIFSLKLTTMRRGVSNWCPSSISLARPFCIGAFWRAGARPECLWKTCVSSGICLFQQGRILSLGAWREGTGYSFPHHRRWSEGSGSSSSSSNRNSWSKCAQTVRVEATTSPIDYSWPTVVFIHANKRHWSFFCIPVLARFPFFPPLAPSAGLAKVLLIFFRCIQRRLGSLVECVRSIILINQIAGADGSAPGQRSTSIADSADAIQW